MIEAIASTKVDRDPEIRGLDSVEVSIDTSHTRMSANALQSLESELDRLERQRLGYALALASSQDERTRARHERTLARLDEEIAALSEAAATLADVAVAEQARPAAPGGVPMVDRTTEMDAETYDELAMRPRSRTAMWLGIAAAVAVVIGAAWWLAQPAPAANAKPAAAGVGAPASR
jgi:hypothetical protein